MESFERNLIVSWKQHNLKAFKFFSAVAALYQFGKSEAAETCLSCLFEKDEWNIVEW